MIKRPIAILLNLFLLTEVATIISDAVIHAGALQALGAIEPASGLRLIVVKESASPRLRLLVPGESDATQGIQVEFPEHAWGRIGEDGSPSLAGKMLGLRDRCARTEQDETGRRSEKLNTSRGVELKGHLGIERIIRSVRLRLRTRGRRFLESAIAVAIAIPT